MNKVSFIIVFDYGTIKHICLNFGRYGITQKCISSLSTRVKRDKKKSIKSSKHANKCFANAMRFAVNRWSTNLKCSGLCTGKKQKHFHVFSSNQGSGCGESRTSGFEQIS